MSPDELRAAAERIVWWHTMDLGHSVVTKGIEANTADKLAAIRLPGDLRGRTVLDVGAWDGFFSFEAERRGAARVVAVDTYSWGKGGWATKDGFELARRALNSRVEDAELEVVELSPERLGTFDIVLFLGVLYHMRHPLLALERVSSVTRELLILETHVDLNDHDQPAMAFYPGAELTGDPSNWWGPNELAVAAMLRDVGFREVETVWRVSSTTPGMGRIAVHARR